MEYLQQVQTLITDNLGPYGPLLVVGFLGFFLILITLPVLLRKEVDPLDRLKSNANSGGNNKKRRRVENFSDARKDDEMFLKPDGMAFERKMKNFRP